MLDLKFIRENPDKVKKACEDRGKPADIDGLLSLDEKRRKALKETEDIKRNKNIASGEIAKRAFWSQALGVVFTRAAKSTQRTAWVVMDSAASSRVGS